MTIANESKRELYPALLIIILLTAACLSNLGVSTKDVKTFAVDYIKKYEQPSLATTNSCVNPKSQRKPEPVCRFEIEPIDPPQLAKLIDEKDSVSD